MQIDESNKENKEWIKKVLLAHYKRLSIRAVPLTQEEKKILIIAKQKLLKDGFTEEMLNQEVSEYKKLSEEERKKQIDEKIEALVCQIYNHLENNDEISSKDYPELYHRIQEILAINPDIAKQLINAAFQKENIHNGMDCSNSLYGGQCSYYFSKKLTYE